MAITKDTLKAMSTEEALSLGWDDIPELGNKLWPIGTYIATTAVTEDTVNDSDVIKVNFTLDEVVEKANEDDETLEPGTTLEMAYFMPSGVAGIKQDYYQVATEMGCTGVVEFLKKFTGCRVTVTLGHRVVKGKNGADPKTYNSIKACVLVA